MAPNSEQIGSIFCGLLKLNAIKGHTFISQSLVKTINQKIAFLQCQYPWSNQAQWRDSWNGVQQQNRRNSSVASMGLRMCQCLCRKAKSKRCVLRCFLKVATEMSEWTDSGRLFQRNGAQEWKALSPVSVLTLGTGRPIPSFDVSEQAVLHAGFVS